MDWKKLTVPVCGALLAGLVRTLLVGALLIALRLTLAHRALAIGLGLVRLLVTLLIGALVAALLISTLLVATLLILLLVAARRVIITGLISRVPLWFMVILHFFEASGLRSRFFRIAHRLADARAFWFFS